MSELPHSPAERYTIISSDCHAGGNMAAYVEYLDPSWRDEFQAWRGAYRKPVPRPAGRRSVPQLG